jgi:nucleotide-binding universal stress UspA family protein
MTRSYAGGDGPPSAPSRIRSRIFEANQLWETTDGGSVDAPMAATSRRATLYLTLPPFSVRRSEMKILVAYDGSESAHRALDQAEELANDGAEISVVSVAEPLPQFGRAGAMLAPEEEEERAQQLVDAKTALAGRGVSTKVVERKGDPASMIIDEAERQDVDFIFMGSRRLNAVQRFLLGSVSSKVVHRAPCDVLVVR